MAHRNKHPRIKEDIAWQAHFTPVPDDEPDWEVPDYDDTEDDGWVTEYPREELR